MMKSGTLEDVESFNCNDYAETKDGEVLVTNAPAKSIKAIDKTTVHRICSGQVVLTLATAVKELVENSIDAGSTSVEIRLKDHGSSLIEVSDNGGGVEPEDFEGLTLKHHTSKLQDFGDLIGVKTFGFRGEALSSLCALTNLAILTRHKNQAVGTKLVYNANGHLTNKTPLSRLVGTTVSLHNLFHTLPVRHKEFLRNLKKEFNKMVQILYSYCLITTDVRIVCTNESGKGGRTTVVSTESHSSLKQNISSIFGHKQVAHLLEIKQRSPDEEVRSEYGVQEIYNDDHFELSGFVSSCAHGKGRYAADRQFYFINSRPCDPAKVVRVVNEVFHHYNKHQFPMVVLDIRMRDGDVDVNVTPDKRQIMVNRERLLLATVKTTLICLYESIPSTLDVRNASLQSFSSQLQEASSASPAGRSSPKGQSSSPATPRLLSSLSQRFARSSPSPHSPLPGASRGGGKKTFGAIKRALSTHASLQSAAKQPKLQDFSFKLNYESSQKDECSAEDEEVLSIDSDMKGVDEGEGSPPPEDPAGEHAPHADNEPLDVTQLVNGGGDAAPHVATGDSSKDSIPKVPRREIHSKTDAFLNSLKSKRNSTSLSSSKNGVAEVSVSGGERSKTTGHTDTMDPIHSSQTESPTRVFDDVTLPESAADVDVSPPEVVFDDDVTEVGRVAVDAPWAPRVKSLRVPFALAALERRLARRRRRRRAADEDGTARRDAFRKFKAQINPTDNGTAEEELKREISKDSFKQMLVLGQFNLGFVVTRLGSDLFIIDQHATDEKFNFEALQRTCVLQNQKLIAPQPLELTVANEAVLRDNVDVFARNGFEFEVDEAQAAGRRVRLTSMPVSRGWEFTRDDVEEMVFMLSDAPGVMCRPSRVSAMFASRACRKSVMVGTSLGGAQMRRLVDHMAETEQPWNCPHGRPTVRHLVNLDLIAKLD